MKKSLYCKKWSHIFDLSIFKEIIEGYRLKTSKKHKRLWQNNDIITWILLLLTFLYFQRILYSCKEFKNAFISNAIGVISVCSHYSRLLDVSNHFFRKIIIASVFIQHTVVYVIPRWGIETTSVEASPWHSPGTWFQAMFVIKSILLTYKCINDVWRKYCCRVSVRLVEKDCIGWKYSNT